MYLRELEDNGLVGHEQKGGERIKYYYVTEYAEKILTAIIEATRTPESKPRKIEEWQIDEFLNVIEDTNLSKDIRLSYSTAFHDVCTGNSAEVIGHGRVQRLFEKVTADPFHDEVTEDLKRSVSSVLPYALQDEMGKQWVLRRLYPILIKNLEKQDEKTRTWTVRQVGKVAGLTFKRAEAIGKFLHIWFSDGTDPNSEFGKEVKQQLSDLGSKVLFTRVKVKAKDQNTEVRKKAEILLEELKRLLRPK
jgi:hypothetical protein